jgi:molybdopterin/thiamine biosynthesis adenylyltransferase
MTHYRLRISEDDFNALRRWVMADLPREAGAFALAGVAELDGQVDVTVRRIVTIPREHFTVQENLRLEVSAQAVNGLIGLCEANKAGAVLCHSHPDDTPYSPSDSFGERRIFEVLRPHIPPKAPTASLLFYPGGARGRIWLPGRPEPHAFQEIIVVGRCLRRLPENEGGASDLNDEERRVYDRQIRAFGQGGQSLIRRAKVGIVGLGGTGSAVAEQLARLGVQDFVLVDHDRISASNITRVYGSYAPRRWDDVVSWLCPGRRYKVRMLAQHLQRINPAIRLQAVPLSVVETSAARALLDRDVILLCTDDHWGRSIVDQIVHQFLIPAINLGVQVSSGHGVIGNAAGAVDVLRPDQPCLWCKQFLSGNRIAAESMPNADRASRKREGYVHDIDTLTPSVVSLTTTVAGMATTLFLQLLTDFMGDRGDVSRLNWDILEGTVRRGTTTVLQGCQCTRHKGFGDLHALPTVSAGEYRRQA